MGQNQLHPRVHSHRCIISTINKLSVVDLSDCDTIQTLTMTHACVGTFEHDDGTCHEFDSPLASLNLRESISLTRFQGVCIRLVTYQGLFSCTTLKFLECSAGCIKSLDFSHCTLLDLLDVDSSFALKTICVTGFGQLVTVLIEGFPFLNVNTANKCVFSMCLPEMCALLVCHAFWTACFWID